MMEFLETVDKAGFDLVTTIFKEAYGLNFADGSDFVYWFNVMKTCRNKGRVSNDTLHAHWIV